MRKAYAVFVCRKIRKFSETPVQFCTARNGNVGFGQTNRDFFAVCGTCRDRKCAAVPFDALKHKRSVKIQTGIVRILFKAPTAFIRDRQIVIHRIPFQARLIEVAFGIAFVKLLNIPKIQRFAFKKDVGAVVFRGVPKRFVAVLADRIGIGTKRGRRRGRICFGKQSAGFACLDDLNSALVGIAFDKLQLKRKAILHALPAEAVLLTNLRIGKP